MGIAKDITGQKFGRLKAVELSKIIKSKRGSSHYWRCICDCGVEKVIQKQKLTCGETKSCGCLQREIARNDSTTHGLTGHPIWSLYRDIKNRCYNENVVHYNLYGGRGVRMCDEWLNNFRSFYDWCMANGWRKGLQLDKDKKAKELGIEPLLYSPCLCQFVTPKINNNNRRSNVFVEFNGENKTIAEWSDEYNISQQLVGARLRRGWPIDKALIMDTKLTGKRKC